MINNILDQLKRDEGFVDHIYVDSVGKRTVGYGHNLDANPIKNLPIPLPEPHASLILAVDIMHVTQDVLDKLPWAVHVDSVRYGVLINMAFNIGVHGLLKFKNMLDFTESGRYTRASWEMLNSVWAKQVGIRALRLSKQMQIGEWQ